MPGFSDVEQSRPSRTAAIHRSVAEAETIRGLIRPRRRSDSKQRPLLGRVYAVVNDGAIRKDCQPVHNPIQGREAFHC
jgi:hypothetical protein